MKKYGITSWFGTVGRHRNCKRFQTTRCKSAERLHLEVAICSSCHKTSRLAVYQKNNERGLSELLLLKCSCCEAETPLSTSRRLGGKGGGPVSTDVCQKHLIKTENATKKHAEEVMNGAAERLQNKVLKEQPDQIEDDEDIIACVSVTVDGTWQKRGHSSKLGVVFVITVETGETWTMRWSNFFATSAKNILTGMLKVRSTSSGKISWLPHQSQRFIRGMEQMEAVAAVEIFSRSMKKEIEIYHLCWQFGSIGLRSLDLTMKSKKEECVSHVQKWLGTALRKYKKDNKGKKLSDGKMVGGKGRLTDKVIDKMQNYYRKAIRSNKGDLNRMKESIKAIQYHMIKNGKLALKNTNIAQRLVTPGANTGRIRMRKQNCIMRTITFQRYLWQSWIPFFKGYLKMIYWTDVWKALHKTKTKQQVAFFGRSAPKRSFVVQQEFGLLLVQPLLHSTLMLLAKQ